MPRWVVRSAANRCCARRNCHVDRRPRHRNHLSSKKSFQDAIEKGIARAAKTLKNVEGAWIQDQKIVVEDGKISAYRVNMKVTFILAD